MQNQNNTNLNYDKYNNSRDQTARSYTDRRENNYLQRDMSRDYRAEGFAARRGNEDRPTRFSNFLNNSQDNSGGEYAGRRGVEDCGNFGRNSRDSGFTDRRGNEDRGTFMPNYPGSRDYTAVGFADHRRHNDRGNNDNRSELMSNFSNNSQNYSAGNRASNFNNSWDYRGNEERGGLMSNFLNDSRDNTNADRSDFISNYTDSWDRTADRLADRRGNEDFSNDWRNNTQADRRGTDDRDAFQPSNYNSARDDTAQGNNDRGKKYHRYPNYLMKFRDYIIAQENLKRSGGGGDCGTFESDNTSGDNNDHGEKNIITGNLRSFRDNIERECTATNMNDDRGGEDDRRTDVNVGHVGGWSTSPRLHKTPTEGLLQPRVRCNNRLPFIPRIGEPGGLDDRRRIGLSGAGIRWYLRFLDEGHEPDEARRLAGEKRIKDEPTNLHARLMKKRNYIPIIPTEEVPPKKVKTQRIESPTRKKKRLIAKSAKLFERYLPHLKADEQNETVPEDTKEEIVESSSSTIPKKICKNDKRTPFLPPPGQPGGLDDPRRRALSGAGNRWYLRYLGRGIEPNKAWKMALDRRTKPMKGQAESTYMSPSEDDEEQESERTTTTSESSRNNTITNELATSVKRFKKKRTDETLPPLGKPGARDDPRRKGLSGAGTKWYIRFLNQGYEPDEARRKAEEKRTKSSPEHTKIVVLPKEFPEESLVTEELEILQEAIMKEASLDPAQNLLFDGIHLKPGMLLVVCASPATAEWLKSKISKLSTWNGVQLMARLEGDIPPAYIVSILLPRSECQDDNLKVISLISKQNPELNTRTWKILSNRKQSKGQSVMILIDKESFETMKNGDGTIHYKLAKIQVNGLKKPRGNTEARDSEEEV